MWRSERRVLESEKVHLGEEMLEPGKKRRVKRIFRDDNRTVIVPMDHGVTLGPVTRLVNMQAIVNKLLLRGVDTVVLQRRGETR